MASIIVELTPDSDLADVIAHWDVNLDRAPGKSASLKFAFPNDPRVYRLTVMQVQTDERDPLVRKDSDRVQFLMGHARQTDSRLERLENAMTAPTETQLHTLRKNAPYFDLVAFNPHKLSATQRDELREKLGHALDDMAKGDVCPESTRIMQAAWKEIQP